MRKILLSTCLAMGLVAALAPGVEAKPFPDRIPLPAGFQPEGIAVGRGTTFYVGSLTDGTVLRGDLRTGVTSVLTAPVGPFSTVGVEVDRWNRVWVAGGVSGTGRVYDGGSGQLLASYSFTAPFESFVNDVVVTRNAAYFTDSGTANDPDPSQFRLAGEPRLFVVPIGPGGALPAASRVVTVPVDAPDITFPNLNGIEWVPGHGLVVGHTVGQVLFWVNARTGATEVVDLDVALVGNDGIIGRGRTLYVVENALARISVLEVASDGSATVIDVLPVVGADTPTTAALFGAALYAVDARFNAGPGPYAVFRVPIHS
jgi:hypothetical protein